MFTLQQCTTCCTFTLSATGCTLSIFSFLKQLLMPSFLLRPLLAGMQLCGLFVLLNPYSLTPSPTSSRASSLLSCTGGIVASPGPNVSVSIEAARPPPAAAPAPSLPLSATTVASELINTLVTPSPMSPPSSAQRPAGPAPASAPLSPAPGLHVSQTLSADGPLTQAAPSPPCICQEADAPAQQGRRLLGRGSSSRRNRSRADSHPRRLSSTERRLLQS